MEGNEYMGQEEEWEREGLLDPAWEKQQRKVNNQLMYISLAMSMSSNFNCGSGDQTCDIMLQALNNDDLAVPRIGEKERTFLSSIFQCSRNSRYFGSSSSMFINGREEDGRADLRKESSNFLLIESTCMIIFAN